MKGGRINSMDCSDKTSIRPAFIKGLDLSEGFFFEIAKPILDKHFSNQ
jgi:hypothetical protein